MSTHAVACWLDKAVIPKKDMRKTGADGMAEGRELVSP